MQGHPHEAKSGCPGTAAHSNREVMGTPTGKDWTGTVTGDRVGMGLDGGTHTGLGYTWGASPRGQEGCPRCKERHSQEVPKPSALWGMFVTDYGRWRDVLSLMRGAIKSELMCRVAPPCMPRVGIRATVMMDDSPTFATSCGMGLI